MYSALLLEMLVQSKLQEVEIADELRRRSTRVHQQPSAELNVKPHPSRARAVQLLGRTIVATWCGRLRARPVQ